MAYVGSDNILVFPTTRRDSVQRSARLLSEQSLVSIINQLVDFSGFVISQQYSTNDAFEFNINGYYFKVTAAGMGAMLSALNNPTNVWAEIVMTTTPTTSQGDSFVELDGQDNNNEYRGVTFTSTEPSEQANHFNLKILTKVDNTYIVPRESQIRFDADMVFGDLTVDGGVIS